MVNYDCRTVVQQLHANYNKSLNYLHVNRNDKKKKKKKSIVLDANSEVSTYNYKNRVNHYHLVKQDQKVLHVLWPS